MKKTLLPVICLFAFSLTIQAQGWQPLINGSDALYAGYTTVLATDPSGNLYATGSISPYSCVVKWDGSSWSQLVGTTGIGDSLHAAGNIFAITSDSKGNIYAAGNFQDDSGYYYVTKWDGTKWSELGAGIDSIKANAPIHALAVDIYGNIYAGGEFTNTDYNSNANGNYYVAKWDGTKWTALNTTVYGTTTTTSCSYTYITAIATDNKGNLYATYESEVEEWDATNSTWNLLAGLDLNGQINTLAADSSGNLYAGGCFNYTIGSSLAYPVMKWNGTTWSKLDSTGSSAIGYSINGPVNALIADKSGNVYAAGSYGITNLSSFSGYFYVAQWTGSGWNALAEAPTGDTLNYSATALAIDKSGNLYVSGYFSTNSGGDYVREWTTTSITTAVTNAASSSLAVNVFPNPTNGSFTINAPEGGQVAVYSALGQTVATQNVSAGNTTIYLDNVPTGVYTVILSGQTSSYPAVKVVKN